MKNTEKKQSTHNLNAVTIEVTSATPFKWGDEAKKEYGNVLGIHNAYKGEGNDPEAIAFSITFGKNTCNLAAKVITQTGVGFIVSGEITGRSTGDKPVIYIRAGQLKIAYVPGKKDAE